MLRYFATEADRRSKNLTIFAGSTLGAATYDFANVFMFCIGASIASIFLAMIAWHAKSSE